MRRFLPIIVLVFAVFATVGAYFFNQYWIHRFDDIIERQAAIYRLDPKLVWSVIYQETYFRPWMTGEAGEVGLMQIMPGTAREWASETGLQDLEKQIAANHAAVLSDPERNIQIGCWYLEKLRERFRDTSSPEARAIAAYNAGASRVNEWDKRGESSAPLTEEEFIRRIGIPSTQNYVSEILRRYRKLKK
ncbi:MAG TPA: lytic transglycosylase domain-containing protein [Pyrinomonadaceae bacterium]|nr:lytic transglycosylase domain-containing protein [Pyrinomonadaceae bacterium]